MNTKRTTRTRHSCQAEGPSEANKMCVCHCGVCVCVCALAGDERISRVICVYVIMCARAIIYRCGKACSRAL